MRRNSSATRGWRGPKRDDCFQAAAGSSEGSAGPTPRPRFQHYPLRGTAQVPPPPSSPHVCVEDPREHAPKPCSQRGFGKPAGGSVAPAIGLAAPSPSLQSAPRHANLKKLNNIKYGNPRNGAMRSPRPTHWTRVTANPHLQAPLRPTRASWEQRARRQLKHEDSPVENSSCPAPHTSDNINMSATTKQLKSSR